jgi:hypothetical protein
MSLPSYPLALSWFLNQDALEKCFYLRWVVTVYELVLISHQVIGGE